jgi:hypothetical protein
VLKPKSLPLFPNLFNFNTKIKLIFQQISRGRWKIIMEIFLFLFDSSQWVWGILSPCLSKWHGEEGISYLVNSLHLMTNWCTVGPFYANQLKMHCWYAVRSLVVFLLLLRTLNRMDTISVISLFLVISYLRSMWFCCLDTPHSWTTLRFQKYIIHWLPRMDIFLRNALHLKR